MWRDPRPVHPLLTDGGLQVAATPCDLVARPPFLFGLQIDGHGLIGIAAHIGRMRSRTSHCVHQTGEKQDTTHAIGPLLTSMSAMGVAGVNQSGRRRNL
jgi:hypothetical protein